jgi:hypothetical protein
MKKIKKYKVVFWLMSGEYEEIVDAYNDEDARKQIYKKYENRFCQVNFTYQIPLDKLPE